MYGLARDRIDAVAFSSSRKERAVRLSNNLEVNLGRYDALSLRCNHLGANR